MTIYKIKLTLGIVVLMQINSVYGYKPRVNKSINEVDNLVYRSLNFALKNEDYESLEIHINQFINASKPKEVVYPISMILNIVKLNQPPKKTLDLIQTSAIAAGSFNTNSDDIADIIWWSEVRLMENIEFNAFIMNQVNSHRMLDALAILVERGHVKSLKLLSEKITSELSEVEFYYFIRQAEIRKILLAKEPGFDAFVIDEVKLSFNEYLILSASAKHTKLERRLVSEHLKWVIKQLGVNRKSLVVQNILNNMSENTYYYSQYDYDKTLQNIPSEQRIDFLRTTEERLELKDRISTALNPYKKIRK